MIRKAVLTATLSLGLAAGGVMPSLATATEFHTRDFGGYVYAAWSSCRTVPIGEPCALSVIQAVQIIETYDNERYGNGKQDCIEIGQARGINQDGMYPDFREFTDTFGYVCGVGSVNVSASLTRGEVRGEVPAQDCHFGPTQLVCVPTTLRIGLEWRSSGDVTRSPGVIDHHSDYAPEARCLEHFLPSRSTLSATATGQVDGFSAPLGELTGAYMAFGGVIEHGTVPFCFD
jgi:hypothetical protein